MTEHRMTEREEHPNSAMGRARAQRDALRARLHEHQQRYARYQRELDERRQFLAYATPENDALEIAKAAAMIPVYEQTIARLGPDIRDRQQELSIAERELRRLEEHHAGGASGAMRMPDEA